MRRSEPNRIRETRMKGLLAVLLCASAVMVSGTVAAPAPFQLTFDGHHGVPMGAGYRHEGPFTSSPPFCTSGTVVDLRHSGDNATRLYTCDDRSGTVTMQVTNFLAEHAPSGTGTWRITEGTAEYASLRGKGTWTTVPGEGVDEPFRSTLRGVADLDGQAPTITISRATAERLARPTDTYAIRLVFSARDNVDGNPVSYAVTASGLNKTWTRVGRAVSGPVTMTLKIRLPKQERRVRLEVTATDPLDNQRRTSRMLKLPPASG